MMHILSRLLSAALVTTAATAQAAGSHAYALDQGFIRFTAPAAWPVIMEKTEGDPQFIAFQVRDPADAGSGEATRVTVETRLLDDSANFQPLVNAAIAKAKQLPGYEQRSDGVEPTVLRYFAQNGKTRYEYRETWYLNGHLLVHVRCARPLLPGTSPQWTAEYEQGCAEIMTSLKPH
jgi:hypothetical protein